MALPKTKRPHRRLYAAEVLAYAHVAVVVAVGGQAVTDTLPAIRTFILSAALQMGAGIAVRSLIALVRRDRAYFRRIATAGWLTDSVRLCLLFGGVAFSYGWIKLAVPVYHPRYFDAELWRIDEMLFFGMAPSVFFAELFSSPAIAMRVIDWAYARIFFVSMLLILAFMLSAPDRRLRFAFATSSATLWLTGAWLYLAVPSLGPAYRFPDVWMQFRDQLVFTQQAQAVLMRNFQNVIRSMRGEPTTAPILLLFGIAAFPSLHVGFQTFAFLWSRRIWLSGQVIFGTFVVIIFIGSMVTGWHYLVDGFAGMALALAAYAVAVRAYRMRRYFALRGAMRRA